MNGRIKRGETPEERLAAVAKSLMDQMEKKNRAPDYADFRDTFRPFIHAELLRARIDEARQGCGRGLTSRVEELAAELKKVSATFPDAYRLQGGA